MAPESWNAEDQHPSIATHRLGRNFRRSEFLMKNSKPEVAAKMPLIAVSGVKALPNWLIAVHERKPDRQLENYILHH
jgi:hypothetical protein